MREYFIWLAKFITVIGVIFVVLPIALVLLVGGITAVLNHDKIANAGNKAHRVAVVELNGVIMESRDTIDELYRQVEDKENKGIVLRIDSPGGAVGPSQEIFSTVKKLKERKPIVVSMGAVAASGGLYSALGASKIFAQPGTQTGSIGVIIQFPNLTNIAEKLGFQMITVKSGKLKDVGNTFRPVTSEDTEFLQSTVARSHEDFMQAVVDGRGIPLEKVREFADGRVILGRDAKDLKLIDELGSTMDAARAVFEILGEPLPADEDPLLFYPADKYREFKKLLNSVSSLPELLSARGQLKYLAF